MQFEYDMRKSESNLRKHGIDFFEAQDMWLDPFRIEYDIDYGGERRFATVAKLADGYWTAICTMREKNVRIISVRRSVKEEASEYDKAKNDR